MQTKLTLRLDSNVITRALAGSLSGSKLDERDYRRYLEKKYL